MRKKTTSQTLSASLEDYLEAIFHIAALKQAAKAKDISERLKVNKSSVTGALRALSDRGLVNYAPYDIITLTPKGKAFAERVVRRHVIFRDFLVKVLGVDEKDAEESACRVEHAMPGEILERLALFVEYIELRPGGRKEFVEAFSRYCDGHSERGADEGKPAR